MTFQDDRLADVLTAFAARTPSPGGGSGAALTCALAASLVQMVGAFGLAGETGEIAVEAARLRTEAEELAERDLASYAGVLAVLRRDRSDPGREPALAQALSEATDVPLAVAHAACRTATLAARAADGANRWLAGDAAAAAQIACGACRAAAALVTANLRDLTDDRPVQAAQYAQEAEVACQRAMSRTTES